MSEMWPNQSIFIYNWLNTWLPHLHCRLPSAIEESFKNSSVSLLPLRSNKRVKRKFITLLFDYCSFSEPLSFWKISKRTNSWFSKIKRWLRTYTVDQFHGRDSINSPCQMFAIWNFYCSERMDSDLMNSDMRQILCTLGAFSTARG